MLLSRFEFQYTDVNEKTNNKLIEPQSQYILRNLFTSKFEPMFHDSLFLIDPKSSHE